MIAVFNCPSDTDRLTDPNGHNNYMANSGSAPNCDYGGNADTPAWSGPAAGPFIYSDSGTFTGLTFGGSSINIAAITDGTSNTAAFSERVKAIGNNFTGTSAPFDGVEADRIAVDPAAVANKVEGQSQPYYQICIVTPPVPVNGNQDAANFNDDNISGAMWVIGPAGLDALHSRDAAQHLELPLGIQIAHVANSRHPGGVNVLFCDGRSSSSRRRISLPTWWALGTRAGGEVISSRPVLTIAQRRVNSYAVWPRKHVPLTGLYVTLSKQASRHNFSTFTHRFLCG